MCFEYFLKPLLSPSASGLTGFILGEQAALNPSLNPGKASPNALNQALGLNSKILLATMKGIESRHGLVSCDAIRNQILLTLGNSEKSCTEAQVLARILPLAFLPVYDIQLLNTVTDVAAMTHSTNNAVLCSCIYAEFIRQLAQGERNKRKAVEAAAIAVGGRYSVATLGEQLDLILNSEKVGNNGDIASTLILALYCFEKSKSFDSCIHMAAQDVAGDRKLISAVAGSFAGVYYKLHSRPIQDVTRYEAVINGLD